MAAANVFVCSVLLALVCFLSRCPQSTAFVPTCNTTNCTDADLCPTKCICLKPPENITDCSNKDLETLPELGEINTYTRILRMSQNRIGTLWEIDLPYLKEYFVDRNDLKYLKDNAFMDMRNLTLLNLSYNSIEEVTPRPLQYLVSLKTLDISHNNLTKLLARNFDGTALKQLATLDLSHNAITTIENDSFYELKNLLKLKLCHNQMKTLSPDIFTGITGLTTLYLDHNSINQISSRTFQPMSSLVTLTLNSNDLTDLDRLTFFNLDQLESLNLGYNKFGKVPSESLREVGALSKLILDGNPIVKIEKEDFPVTLKQLVTLSISDMRVLNVIHGNAFDDFIANLTSVNISMNPQLTSLAHHLFYRSFHKLRVVDISRNSLTEVDESLLPWNLLSTIDVTGNKWRCDCNVLWMKHYRFHENIKCSTPEAVANKMFTELEENQFVCNRTNNRGEDNRQAIRNGLAATALVVSVLLVVFLVYRFRGHVPCLKKPGTYNTLYNIYDPTRENSNRPNVVIKYNGDQERVDSKTTGVDMDNEMKAIL